MSDEKRLKDLINYYDSISKTNNYEKIIKVLNEIISILERLHGPDNVETAKYLDALGNVYSDLGDYKKAESLHKRSLEILEKLLGPEHPYVATSLNNLANIYSDLGDYHKAEPLYKKALEIYENVLGPEHPYVATSLNNLANLYYYLGDYHKAEPLYKIALEIREKVSGPEHLDVADSLNNLAGLYYYLGDYQKAEPLYKRAIEILEKVLGPEHPDVSYSLNNLANLYSDLGDYHKAKPLYKRSLEIREKALGPEHPDVATILNNLGLLYSDLGDYQKAELMYKRSFEIFEKSLGPEHSKVGEILHNLSTLYWTIGDYKKAEPLYKRALEIREKVLGPEHLDVAMSLNNLANLYWTIGDYKKAEPLYKRALEILEKVLGPEHPDVAYSLNILGFLYLTIGEYQKAEPLFKRSLGIKEKVLGPEHPDVATSLNNLSLLYLTIGEYQKAEPLYRRVFEIYEKVLGPEHPDVAQSLYNLSLLYTSTHRPEEAIKCLLRSINIENTQIKNILGMVDEATALNFISDKNKSIHLLINLTYNYFPEDTDAIKQAFNMWFLRKGVLLDAHTRFHDVIFSDETEEVKKLLERLKYIIKTLTHLYYLKKDDDYEKTKKQIEHLEKEKEDIRLELINKSKAFSAFETMWDADIDDILKLIPPESSIIDFALIPQYDFDTNKWKDAHYYVFIISHDSVELLDLGDASTINNLIDQLRQNIFPVGERGTEVIEIPIHSIARVEEDGFRQHSHALYRAIFAPYRDKIKDNILLSPDGYLNLIPFEVLVDEEGAYLIDREYLFNYIATPRELFLLQLKEGEAKESLLMGDPDFDMDIPSEEPPASAVRGEKLFKQKLLPLPATKEEVQSIHSILGNSYIYTGRNAREDILMNAVSPRFLHLATHGFFLEDISNSLIGSFIPLAGANRALIDKDSFGTGIVNGEKVLNLKLKGTEMVVLSACNTGLGNVKTGEGIFGLRRAFIQAGARSIVTSLWKVPDRETKELMVAFYKNIINNKKRARALSMSGKNHLKNDGGCLKIVDYLLGILGNNSMALLQFILVRGVSGKWGLVHVLPVKLPPNPLKMGKKRIFYIMFFVKFGVHIIISRYLIFV